jgi:nitrate/nitrite transporter NarK
LAGFAGTLALAAAVFLLTAFAAGVVLAAAFLLQPSCWPWLKAAVTGVTSAAGLVAAFRD